MTLETFERLIVVIAVVLVGIFSVTLFGVCTVTYYLAQIARESRLARILRDD